MVTRHNLNLRSAIRAKQKNERYPVVRMVREDPGGAAVISKLNKSKRNPERYDVGGRRSYNDPNVGEFKSIAEKKARSISDNETALQMLPDLELAGQILISIILSPKDMITVDPFYTASDTIMNSELKGELLEIIKEYFTTNHDINSFLSKALRHILFEDGSYPMAVLPENTVDFAINSSSKVSLESMQDVFNSDGSLKPLGLIGPPDESISSSNESVGISLENLAESSYNKYNYVPTLNIKLKNKQFDTGIKIIDNFNALKIPLINKKIIEDRHNDILFSDNVLNTSLEDNLKMTDRDLVNALFKDRSAKYELMNVLRTDAELERMSVGEPLIMHLPAESVLPVFVPGSPDKQIGFFVLLDVNGNPLDLSSQRDNYGELSQLVSGTGSFASAMLNKAKTMFDGFDCYNNTHLDYLANIYSDMIESDLLNRLKNGRYTNSLAIARKEEIYRVMLARSLSNKSTQLLWVPESLMTYFAFKYDSNGIGKSLLDDLKIINSLRALTTMASVMAMLKNSINRTGVRIKFDPDDPNPQKTFENVVHEILRSRQKMIPWGTINPADIADWATKAGLEFVYEGHPGMPDVGIDFEDRSTQVNEPNQDLIEELRKQTSMGLGIPPEMLDATLEPEFATSVVKSNILLSKRAIQYQNLFLPLVSSHIRKVIKATPSIINDLLNRIYDGFNGLKLTEILKKKVVGDEELKVLVCKEVLKDFIESLEIKLPRPDSVSIENQRESLEHFEGILDTAIDSYINSDTFTGEISGTMANQVDSIRAVIKSYYMRKYMVENGIFPELTEILNTFDEDGNENEIFNTLTGINKSLVKNFGRFLIDLRKAKGKGDKLLEILGSEGSESDSQTDSYFGGGDESEEDDDLEDEEGLEEEEDSDDLEEEVDEEDEEEDEEV